ncbi:hypothetical protein [Azospirillum canadense]|uniref:hypothetical protein n=1 Tax=Azospirillum canadense TaxID=403962 RepID=UPI002227184D|nr:hypothetical protein [Azospirillum canadense]MCW2238189.1 stress response protein YsnF [Azospirillum canadense]
MSASAILKLQKAGFSSEQVEALADFMDSQAASKADVERVEHRLETLIAEPRAESKAGLVGVESTVTGVKSELRLVENGLRAELKQIEQRMTIKLGGMLVVMTGILLTTMRYLMAHP